MEPKFTHLHLHTEYSLLDGMCALDRGEDHRSPLMERARDLGQAAIAITDHGNLFGAVHFYKAARKHGLKPVLGCEIYVTPGDHRKREREEGGKQANHLVLLADGATGFANLMKLVSKAHLDGFYYKPRIDRPLLAEHREGLIGLSACLKGEVAEALLNGYDDKAQRLAGEYAEILGKDRFYLEVQDHGLKDQAGVNRKLVALARKLKLPLRRLLMKPRIRKNNFTATLAIKNKTGAFRFQSFLLLWERASRILLFRVQEAGAMSASGERMFFQAGRRGGKIAAVLAKMIMQQLIQVAGPGI